jgi:hypothetical protein
VKYNYDFVDNDSRPEESARRHCASSHLRLDK